MKRLTVCALTLVVAIGSPVPGSAFSIEGWNAVLPGSGTTLPGVTLWDLLGKASVLLTEVNGAEKVTAMEL